MLGQQLPQKRFKLILNLVDVVNISVTEEADGENGHHTQTGVLVIFHRE